MKIRSLLIGLASVALSLSVAGCTKKSEDTPAVLSSDSIKAAVTDFLSEYKTCLDEKAGSADGGVNYCVKNNSHTTSFFLKDIADTGLDKKGLNPITCIKGFPDRFEVFTATGVTLDEGYAGVHESYAGKTTTVYFQVKTFAGNVQIVGNSCEA